MYKEPLQNQQYHPLPGSHSPAEDSADNSLAYPINSQTTTSQAGIDVSAVFAGDVGGSFDSADTTGHNTKRPTKSFPPPTKITTKSKSQSILDENGNVILNPYGSPIYKAIFNMLAGCGIVGLPYTFKMSGLAVGVVLMFVVAYVSVYTLRLLVLTGKKIGVQDYEKLCRHCFGNFGYFMLSGSILIFDIGACLTYSIILGDSAHDVMHHLFGWDSFQDRQMVVGVIYVVFILPFCLGKDFQFIEKVSACAIGAVTFMIIAIVYEYFCCNVHHPIFENIDMIGSKSGPMLAALGTISFAFVQHDQTFLVYKCLYDNTMKRYTVLASWALGIQVVLCVNISVFGYLSFNKNTNDDILQNYSLNNHVIIVVRIVYTITMAFIYPTAFYVVRHMLYSMIFFKDEETFEDATFFRHLLFTLLPWALFGLASLWLTNLGFVMSLTGLVSALMIAFILPCACYLKVGEYPLAFWNAKSGHKWDACMDVVPKLVLVVFGTAAGIIGTVQLILDEFL